MTTRKKCAGRRRKSQRIYKMKGCNKKGCKNTLLKLNNVKCYKLLYFNFLSSHTTHASHSTILGLFTYKFL